MSCHIDSEIVFVTGNAGKLKELTSIASDNLNFTSQKIDLDEIQSMDIYEIVRHKLHEAFEKVGKPVIVEDVEAGLASLNGLPGPFIKFYEQRLGRDALYKVRLADNDSVTIRCVAGYYDGKQMLFGEGVVQGHIVAPRGENGFGFDGVVVPGSQPDGQQRTFAEMTTEEKSAISHRGQALRSLLSQLSA